MTTRNRLLVGALGVFAALVWAVFVWPTAYRDIPIPPAYRRNPHVFGARVNRFTGLPQLITDVRVRQTPETLEDMADEYGVKR